LIRLPHGHGECVAMAIRKATVGGVLSAFVLAALLVAFFNPSDPGVISGEFEYVQRVVDGDTLVLGTGERVRLSGVDTPESVRPNTPVQRSPTREARGDSQRTGTGGSEAVAYATQSDTVLLKRPAGHSIKENESGSAADPTAETT
jgi:endonuclease YncB( thermonuclease family)